SGRAWAAARRRWAEPAGGGGVIEPLDRGCRREAGVDPGEDEACELLIAENVDPDVEPGDGVGGALEADAHAGAAGVSSGDVGAAALAFGLVGGADDLGIEGELV